jgi:Type ISP C-terminal specificity domain
VLHSPGYRSRYAEFLKIDFPRLLLTGNLNLFRKLARLGDDPVAVHLLKSPKLDRHLIRIVGAERPEVESVSYAKNTVWLDKEQTSGFQGVSDDVWNYHIGGYQVCEKWLKDRKGCKLLKDDIEYYHRVVVALAETIRIMKEIDQVIDKYGGWPGAFSSDSVDSTKLTQADA